MGVKGNKMIHFINFRMKLTLQDSRYFIGQFKAFDKHMNIILGDAEEFRIMKGKDENSVDGLMKRTIGLVLVRGDNIVSITVEGPPPPEDKVSKVPITGPGIAKVAGRGIPPPHVMGINLQMPPPGVGMPPPEMMIPR